MINPNPLLPPTPAERAEWRRLCEAATPEPWVAEWDYVSGDVPDGRPNGEIILKCHPSRRDLLSEEQNKNNAAFIAAARSALPRLLIALEQAERERDEYRSMLEFEGIEHSVQRTDGTCPHTWVYPSTGKCRECGEVVEQQAVATDRAPAERDRLRAELAAERQEYTQEVDEFNAGFEAYKAGVAYEDEPNDTIHDQWSVGWAWAAFNDMRKQLAAAQEQRFAAALAGARAMRDSLMRYAVHCSWCMADRGQPCTCGLDDVDPAIVARDALEAERKP
jgi:hypothetical protein